MKRNIIVKVNKSAYNKIMRKIPGTENSLFRFFVSTS